MFCYFSASTLVLFFLSFFVVVHGMEVPIISLYLKCTFSGKIVYRTTFCHMLAFLFYWSSVNSPRMRFCIVLDLVHECIAIPFLNVLYVHVKIQMSLDLKKKNPVFLQVIIFSLFLMDSSVSDSFSLFPYFFMFFPHHLLQSSKKLKLKIIQAQLR